MFDPSCVFLRLAPFHYKHSHCNICVWSSSEFIRTKFEPDARNKNLNQMQRAKYFFIVSLAWNKQTCLNAPIVLTVSYVFLCVTPMYSKRPHWNPYICFLSEFKNARQNKNSSESASIVTKALPNSYLDLE